MELLRYGKVMFSEIMTLWTIWVLLYNRLIFIQQYMKTWIIFYNIELVT